MEEKIWKLIELANQYEIEKEKSEWVNVDAYVEFKWDYNYNRFVRYDETDHWEWDNLYWDTAVAYLISKSFWFIKWLVENDKIDKDKFICSYEHYISKLDDAIIARLAIQDEPIRFLISILK